MIIYTIKLISRRSIYGGLFAVVIDSGARLKCRIQEILAYEKR